jgi:hypothetical protein
MDHTNIYHRYFRGIGEICLDFEVLMLYSMYRKGGVHD